ncbi:MAG: S8 family peptidase [Bdellovibrionales bacterium]
MAIKIYISILTTLLLTQQASALITVNSFKEDHVPGQLIIKLKSNALMAKNMLLSTGAKEIRSFKEISSALYSFPESTDLQKLALNLQDQSDVDYVELNQYHYLQAAPADPHYSKVYGLNNTGQSGGAHDADIDAPEAWAITKGSKRVLIGVIDTGVDYSHPDIIDNYWVNPGESGLDSRGRNKRTNGIDDDGNGYIDDYKGWDFYSNDNDPKDRHGHGTHCAGIIGARGNNNKGITGVNWYVSIVGLKVFDDRGKTRTDALVAAINYASLMKIPITNNSWGSYRYSDAIKDSIQNANRSNMLFVAAAGNYHGNNDSKPFYPASYNVPNIISVAATDHKDNITSFSNYGSSSVDIGAPGNRIYSSISLNKGSYSFKNGTSMAAPYVAGVAGLLKARRSGVSASKMKRAIINSGDLVPGLKGQVQSGRRLNAYKALNQ